MAKYENSITLARLFDGRDGADGGSGYSMSFSSEEILKIPNGVEDREGKRVPTIAYAPTSLKVKVLFGEEVFNDIEKKLENMTVSVDYYGFDNDHKEWSITNLQNDNIKTLGQLNEVTEFTKQHIDKYNGLFYYSYAQKAFIFNTNVLNYKSIDCYIKDEKSTGTKYAQSIKFIKVEDNILDPDTIYYDAEGVVVENPLIDDIASYTEKRIGYFEDPDGNYIKYHSDELHGLLDIVHKNDGFFKITMVFGDEKIESVFLMRMALTSELATFSVHAAGIDAAIANTKLKFGADGLTITNGGLKLKNNEGIEVFNADNDGNLIITGEINATSGKMTGGKIGGFTIDENTITSADTNLVISNTGEQGSYISVNNLKIGLGATVADSISLNDEAYIYNPKKHNGVVLQSGDTKINTDGSIYITSAKGINWEINKDGSARFDKININSAEIGTSMMKVDTVQAVGSSMIFKPSYLVYEITIDTIDNTKVTVTLQTAPAKSSVAQRDEFVLLAQESNFYIAKVANISTSDKELTANEKAEGLHKYIYELQAESEIKSLTNSQIDVLFTVLGKTDDFIFSINSNLHSTNLPFANNTLSLTQIANFDNLVLDNKILLGDLSGAGEEYAGKFGLYADNAILTGSLTTKISPNSTDTATIDTDSTLESTASVGTYAGINTLFGASFNALDESISKDKSKIVFWAGSNGTSNTSIQEAPFQVTEAGTLYAQQGYFAGSIISDAEISASRISASEFHATENAPALRLYGTYVGENSTAKDKETQEEYNGIWFMASPNTLDDPKDNNYSFGINALGLYKPSKDYIIKLDPSNDTVAIHTSELQSANLNISKQFAFVTDDQTNTIQGTIRYEDGIKFIQQNNSLHLNNSTKTINLNSAETVIQNKVLFKGTTVKTTTTTTTTTVNTLEYRNVDNGYDLYVTTITEQKEEK